MAKKKIKGDGKTARKKRSSGDSQKLKHENSTKNSTILENVHTTAKSFYDAGLIDKMTMREFDVLCLPEIPDYQPRDIKALRERFNVSQSVFASYMNISTSSLQKWEIGTKKPTGIAMKLLNLIDRKGLEILA